MSCITQNATKVLVLKLVVNLIYLFLNQLKWNIMYNVLYPKLCQYLIHLIFSYFLQNLAII